MQTRGKWSASNVIWTIVFILIVIIWLMPILFALGTSLRRLPDVYDNVLAFIPLQPVFDNYIKLMDRLPLLRIVMNTFTIATTVTVAKLVISFLAAYAFVYFDFRAKKSSYFLFISSIFIPFTVTMIPNYLMINRMGLGDNIFGVVFPLVADATGILLMNQAMRNIPYSLIEVAKLDNISDWRIMKDIIVPLIRPQLTSTGIWFFINSWNEFVWPSLFLKTEENFTLPLALQLFMSAEGGTDFTVAMAISVITMSIPLLLYLVFQKYIIGTFTSAGIK
ncbi:MULTISPECIES: carbohydrate ABC transporter permease [Aerococcus]|uniref:Carbohydrate ABC transporter permease n=2 Tax=Aerococcus TaxID=1375 RepID=A0A0X8FGN3_9LACT|nr:MULTISPECIES: carbohydrate ABC transporter permease [Aerococcus]AEA00620.1 ABC transporter, permease protein [Aerococcus sp. Group 1]AMB96172.1 ABC transporter permease [Aerococcus urinae]KAA9219345.1 carbohydrate ABC transporter permease [Aerococcus loyolae]KAA9264297.1 carbohydrate ABC transporter permease [Aerococcus loyolae]MCY3025762.1 carbohydrate ABC transporter permease [Aerococcus loyolae]